MGQSRPLAEDANIRADVTDEDGDTGTAESGLFSIRGRGRIGRESAIALARVSETAPHP